MSEPPNKKQKLEPNLEPKLQPKINASVNSFFKGDWVYSDFIQKIDRRRHYIQHGSKATTLPPAHPNLTNVIVNVSNRLQPNKTNIAKLLDILTKHAESFATEFWIEASSLVNERNHSKASTANQKYSLYGVNKSAPSQTLGGKNMKIYTWSGMLLIEKMFGASVPENFECSNFPTCFGSILELSIMNSFYKPGKNYTTKDKEAFKKFVKDSAKKGSEFLGVFLQVVPTSVISRVGRFITDFNKPLTDQAKHMNLEIKGIPKSLIPEPLKELQNKLGQKKLDKVLLHPLQVKEVELMQGCWKLIHVAYDVKESSKTSRTKLLAALDNPVKITSEQQAGAAAVLLQLMIGSRARGILMTNIYERVTSEAADPSIPTKESQDIQLFKGWRFLITVKRLTKLRDVEEELYDKSITKPVLYMLLDPSVLNQRVMGDNAVHVTPVDGVKRVMRLMQALRAYMFRDVVPKTVPRQQFQFEPGFNMLAMTDAAAQDVGDIKNTVDKVVRKMEQAMYPHLQQFPFLARLSDKDKEYDGTREGKTHWLRKIYVNYSFHKFGYKNTMKENGYASMTLGHVGYTTSLAYLAVNIIPTLSVDDGNLLEAVSTKFADLESRLDALTQETNANGFYPKIQEQEGYVAGVDEYVTVRKVSIRRLPRNARNTTLKEKVDVLVQKSQELDTLGIEPTWYYLRKLGANSTPLVRDALKKDKTYKQLLKKYESVSKK